MPNKKTLPEIEKELYEALTVKSASQCRCGCNWGFTFRECLRCGDYLRQPTLKDVLFALGDDLHRFNMEYSKGQIYFVADGADFEEINHLFEEGYVNFTWHDKSFDNQSKKTKRKLWELLCNNQSK